MILNDYYDKWRCSDLSQLAPSTIEAYEGTWENHIRNGLGTVEFFKASNKTFLESYAVDMRTNGASKPLIRKFSTMLSIVFSFAQTLGDATGHEACMLTRVTGCTESRERSCQTYTHKEFKLVCEHSSSKCKVFLSVLSETGVKHGECLGINWEDVDYSNRRITISKAFRGNVLSKLCPARVISMSDELSNILMSFNHGRKAGAIFRGSYGQRLSQNSARNMHKSACKKAGIEKKMVKTLRNDAIRELN